jgi:hypothetical protein
MRPLTLAALLLLTACGPRVPAGGQAAFGTVAGHVLAYPCAPVERADSPCPGRAAAHVEVDFRHGAEPPVRAITDVNGDYTVRLAPGSYVVSVGVLRLMSGPKSVTVAAGATVRADIVFDSGIR